MNIIELSLTSLHGSFACDTNFYASYDPTTEEYLFSGEQQSTGNSISFWFSCQDNPIQSNSNIHITVTAFILNDEEFNIRITGTPAIKIGANEYVVTYEDCRLPFDGSTAKIVCRWSE